jgi:hypothetical protein
MAQKFNVNTLILSGQTVTATPTTILVNGNVIAGGGGALGGVTGISITGGVSISGEIDIVGIYGTNVIQSGNTIGVSGGGGGGITATQLESTGTALQNQLSLSGNLTRGTTFFNSDGIPTGAYFLPLWRAPFSCTVPGVHGYITSGTNAVINARRNALDLLISDMTVSPTGTWVSSGIIQNGSFVAGDTLSAEIASVKDFPVSITVQIDFKRP